MKLREPPIALRSSSPAAKPGMIIGKGGSEIEKVRAELQKMTTKKVVVDIKEIKKVDREAQLVAQASSATLLFSVNFFNLFDIYNYFWCSSFWSSALLSQSQIHLYRLTVEMMILTQSKASISFQS